MWEGMQGSFKVLDQLVLRLSRLWRRTVQRLRRGRAGHPRRAAHREADRDRICSSTGPRRSRSTPTASTSCRPHERRRPGEEEQAFIDQVASDLPAGIRLSHDGRYAGHALAPLKTYALLAHDGTIDPEGECAAQPAHGAVLPRRFLVGAARDFCWMNETRCGRTISPWPSVSDAALAARRDHPVGNDQRPTLAKFRAAAADRAPAESALGRNRETARVLRAAGWRTRLSRGMGPRRKHDLPPATAARCRRAIPRALPHRRSVRSRSFRCDHCAPI